MKIETIEESVTEEPSLQFEKAATLLVESRTKKKVNPLRHILRPIMRISSGAELKEPNLPKVHASKKAPSTPKKRLKGKLMNQKQSSCSGMKN